MARTPRRWGQAPIELRDRFDRSVPALLFKIGRYPLHYGSAAAARTLGRVGVSVFAVTEDRFTPTALSRYLSGRFVWPTTGCEEPGQLLDGLRRLGQAIGKQSVLIPTDDEAAVLAAEHAEVLREHFLLPEIAPGLPRQLASKRRLAELCEAAGVPTPRTIRPTTPAELFDAAAELGFPVVLKNDAPWERLSRRAVSGTTVVTHKTELDGITSEWESMPCVMVQEYLPHERTTDWSVHVYRSVGPIHERTLAFTGVVMRSFPAYTGVTVDGLTVANEELRQLALRFCRDVDFRGIAGMNWRYDARDGCYKLLDFNVRAGAKFRMFETSDGIDVVRALHLDLTGRAVPSGQEIAERRYVVGNLALAAAVSYRHDPSRKRIVRRPRGGVERAWLAFDDPLPGIATVIRSIASIPELSSAQLKRGLRPPAPGLEESALGPDVPTVSTSPK
jgi:D-aspartate ligase